ncbi:hypothetical protein DWZ27_08115 [Ruminococcus sp. AF31-16BH]|nr:hypothetical protein DWZ27_08115 [Ruminococcus sp. AF31-16BH]
MYQRWYGAHLFLFGGRGHAEKQFILCAHKIFAGGLRWGGNVLTIMGFQSIMMAGELGGNTG